MKALAKRMPGEMLDPFDPVVLKTVGLGGISPQISENCLKQGNKNSQSSFPLHPMAHRAAPISVSIALGHASANAVKATAGGCSTGSSASLTFPLLSHMSSARREGSEYHF